MRKLLPLFLVVFPSLLAAQTFQVSLNVPIPDNGAPIATIPVSVSGLPVSINSSFGISEVCIDITHTWDSDLDIRLQSPDGTIITIASGLGNDGDNYTGTCLTNNGADGFVVNALPPFTGTFVPMTSLNVFNNNQAPNGTWQLLVDDTYASDTGSVHFFSITFSANPPPDPGAVPIICTYCECPGAAASCDLLPDMTASELIIQQQHIENFGYFNISNATPNIGAGPLEVHGSGNCFCDTLPVPCTTPLCPNGQPVKEHVIQRVYVRTNNNDTLSFYDTIAGTMSYHPSHGHIHVDDWASYTIRSSTSNPDATTWPILGIGTKQSFCLINLSDCTSDYGYCVDTAGNILAMNDVLNAGFGFVSGCGLDQGIYPGMLDIYDMFLNDPINLAGICNGNYYLVSITDPNNNFVESNENNNWVAVPITLTQQMDGPAANFNLMQASTQIAVSALDLSNATSFIWDFGDGSIDTVNASTIHTYTANGTYIVTFTVYSPCGTFVETDTVTITTVGITTHSIPDEYYLKAQPNPAKGITEINYYVSGNNEQVKIELFNVVGKKLNTLANNVMASGNHKLTLDFNDLQLSNGVYFVKMTSAEKHISIRVMNVK